MKKINNVKDYTEYTNSRYDEMKSLLNKSRRLTEQVSSVEDIPLERDEEKTKEYDTEKSTKVFRATIFAIRNNTISKTPAGWNINDVEDIDWFGELIQQPVDILDSF